ncbi:CTSE [Symbiodinium sp. CCMP2592]|nr:CTSE [Symbiodinium sp. CCMP2592]
MGWGGHRSRSPKNKDSTLQWISKKLAVLGRYSDKRPHGLHVDGNGTLSLRNLMECWGNSQGVSEDDVLNAVRTNMTCARTGRPRFALSGNSHTGEWHITVHESGGGWGGGGGGSAWTETAKAETWHEAKSNNSYGNGKSYGYDYDNKKDYSNSYGNNSYSDQNQWQSSGQSDNWKSTASTSSPGWRFQRGADTSTAPSQKEQWKQPTPAPQTQQNVKAQSWRLQGGQWRGKDEQCTRLLGFILKNSWGEVNVDGEGWAAMEDCVAAMQNKNPNLGIESVDDLKQLLQNCDHEGRFAIDQYDRVRKVDRADRQAAAHPAYAPSKPPPTTWTTQKQHKTSGPFNAFAGSKQEPEEEHNTKAWVKEEPDQVDYGGDDEEVAKKKKGGPPGVPPGKHWEMYDDDGVSWWYYEGPKGKWWMQDGQTTPQPWDEGTEES